MTRELAPHCQQRLLQQYQITSCEPPHERALDSAAATDQCAEHSLETHA